MPNLTFSAPRPQLDTTPAQPAAAIKDGVLVTGDANLTALINDPAMRRGPPLVDDDPAAGGLHPDPAPASRDAVAPIEERTARRQDIPPRDSAEAWQESEQQRQSE
jgi:hypothetical protein